MVAARISTAQQPQQCAQKALERSPRAAGRSAYVPPPETAPFLVVAVRFDYGGQQHAAILFNDALVMLGRIKRELPCDIGQLEQYVVAGSGGVGIGLPSELCEQLWNTLRTKRVAAGLTTVEGAWARRLDSWGQHSMGGGGVAAASAAVSALSFPAIHHQRRR